MSKIKLAFEVTDNWNKGDFRAFIKSIKENTNYEVWIISNDDTTAYILSVGEQLSLPDGRIIVTNFTNDKIEAINNYNIDIYFENLQYVVEQINAETDCTAILVNEIPNKYYSKPTYQVEFDKVIKMRSDEESTRVESCD